MANFERVLLGRNEQQIRNELRMFEPRKEYFQKLVDKYAELGLKSLQENDLIELLENPKSFITKQITADEILNIGGLRLNSEKLFDLIEKPAGTDEFINKIISDKQHRSTIEDYHFYLGYFIVGNENKIEVKPEIIERITENCSLYIETQNQLDGYNKVNELVQIINDLNQLTTKNKIGSDTELTELMVWTNGTNVINKTVVKRF
ncbi:hypothetical protein FNW52_02960 [Flavobacterium sp. ZT3R18]|uniref:hypothetical protein n=1 Tax=Flavobacterium sp. ZT3R18 TaxID=2594429 RepID=UPI001179BA94|nr:hypothetical protein [Flavobacterium sp. ZT3R18]TRX37875.1 hypothetical protein FNW52_02960 [Flavobacterium sp. ZT3R18]